MDTSSVPLLHYGLQYQWCSDSDVSSISSPETLSPVHSMDSSLSPTYQRPSESTPRGATVGYPERLPASSCSPGKRSRKASRAKATRVRSKQRESASEKEKMRMRDLTKALHHLRTYLPPSVAPAGQTLTKIETLRLTIRYISYLSAQLGLSEEALFRRREKAGSPTGETSPCPDFLSYFQCDAAEGQWAQSQSQVPNQRQCSPQGQSQPGSGYSTTDCSLGMDLGLHSGRYGKLLQTDGLASGMEMVSQSAQAAHTATSCQVYGKDFCSQLIPREYWG